MHAASYLLFATQIGFASHLPHTRPLPEHRVKASSHSSCILRLLLLVLLRLLLRHDALGDLGLVDLCDADDADDELCELPVAHGLGELAPDLLLTLEVHPAHGGAGHLVHEGHLPRLVPRRGHDVDERHATGLIALWLETSFE